MLKQQILQQFKYINEGDVLRIYNTLIGRLIKVQKVDTQIEGRNFINETLTILLDPVQKENFLKDFSKDNQDKVCRWSILQVFRQEDYYKSDMRKAVHSAKSLHNAMPENSKLTFNY